MTQTTADSLKGLAKKALEALHLSRSVRFSIDPAKDFAPDAVPDEFVLTFEDITCDMVEAVVCPTFQTVMGIMGPQKHLRWRVNVCDGEGDSDLGLYRSPEKAIVKALTWFLASRLAWSVGVNESKDLLAMFTKEGDA